MIRNAGTYVSTVYQSPEATVEMEQHMISSIVQHSRGLAIIIGNLSTHSRTWDTASNTRGAQLAR